LPTILSTKKLTQSQKGHILNAGLAIVDIDFIETEELAFEFSSKVENAIFTSQNGVRAVLSKNIEIENAYCVGKRVGRLIEEKGIRIQFVGRDAEELGQFIIEKESKKKYGMKSQYIKQDIFLRSTSNSLMGCCFLVLRE